MPRNRFPMGNIPWNKGKRTGISPMKGKKHTEEWKVKAKERMLGNDYSVGKVPWNKGLIGYNSRNQHYRWIKDRTKLKKRNERNDMSYKEWRYQIFKRDKHTCRIDNKDCCGKVFAHHILSWHDFPELRYNTNNGITLCQAHHPRVRSEEKRLIPFFQGLVPVSN